MLRKAALAQTGSEALYYCVPAGKKKTDKTALAVRAKIKKRFKNLPKIDRLLQFDKFIIARSNTRR